MFGNLQFSRGADVFEEQIVGTNFSQCLAPDMRAVLLDMEQCEKYPQQEMSCFAVLFRCCRLLFFASCGFLRPLPRDRSDSDAPSALGCPELTVDVDRCVQLRGLC